MPRSRKKGVEEARSRLPEILQQAEKGESTIVTKHGRPVAAIVPLSAFSAGTRQEPLTAAAGSGRGLWGHDSGRTLRKLRDEWNR
jgi:prevent-host-death family protein